MGLGAWFAGTSAVVAIAGATSISAAVIGGIIAGALIGAAIGGITAAVTGGSIGKGMLFGAVGGAVAGGISGALGGTAGGATGGTSSAVGEVAVTSPGGWEAAVASGGEVVGSSGGSTVMVGSAVAAEGSPGLLSGVSSDLLFEQGVSLATSGIQGYAEAEAQKDAMDLQASEAQKERDLKEKLTMEQLATSRATASSANDFNYAERSMLQAEAHDQLTERNIAEYNARVNQSNVDSSNQIRINKANSDEVEAVAAADRDRASQSILGIDETRKGSYVELPEEEKDYTRPTGVLV